MLFLGRGTYPQAQGGTVLDRPTDRRITHYILFCCGASQTKVQLPTTPLSASCALSRWDSARILWTFGEVDKGANGTQHASRIVLRCEWIWACIEAGKRLAITPRWEVRCVLTKWIYMIMLMDSGTTISDSHLAARTPTNDMSSPNALTTIVSSVPGRVSQFSTINTVNIPRPRESLVTASGTGQRKASSPLTPVSPRFGDAVTAIPQRVNAVQHIDSIAVSSSDRCDSPPNHGPLAIDSPKRRRWGELGRPDTPPDPDDVTGNPTQDDDDRKPVIHGIVEGESDVKPLFISPLGLAMTFHVLCPHPLRAMREAIITDEVRTTCEGIAATLTSRK